MKQGYIDWSKKPQEKLIDNKTLNAYFPTTIEFRKLVGGLMERSRDDKGRYMITIDQACAMVQRDLDMGKAVREGIEGNGVMV